MSGLYIYGIMREEDLARVDPAALFPEKKILTVVKDNFGAVAVSTQEEIFRATQEGLLGHFEVLSKLMNVGPVFPIRFGTVAKTEEDARHLLGSLLNLIDPVLDHLNGKVEFDVEARWNPQVAYSKIALADPKIKAFKERVANQGTPPSMGDRLAVGKLVAEAVTNQAELYRQQIKEALREVALESAPLPVGRDKDLFMNMAFFVGETQTEAFEKKLYFLGESFQDAVHFKYAGPLPPYSFTGCEIAAVTPAMLEEVRQTLGLGERFTREEFTNQYRRLSLAWHPDRNAGDPSATERFKRLLTAGALLERFFAQCKGEFVKSALPDTIFLVAKEFGRKEHLEWA
ncbi:MAG: GvpL/GvpF family gas vesicle protein [Candidatus Omnitrophica bacterium]|nr:GvpL/GvpF family gas vesicle protein [Candidatus Omnitrophota bacterium]